MTDPKSPAARIAILSESPVDEAALEVLVAGVLGGPFERVRPSLRARGWPNVLQILPAVIRHLHFNTAAELLVTVVDSDDSVVHMREHGVENGFHPRCRLCQLAAVFRKTVKRLPAVSGRRGLRSGLGLAVPAMEAWYLCGHDPAVSESQWVEGQLRREPPYTRAELKWRVYGTDRPSLDHAIACAVRETQRQQADLRRLEYDFPGFSCLAADVRQLTAAASVATPER